MTVTLVRFAEQTTSSPYWAIAARFRQTGPRQALDFVEIMAVLDGHGAFLVPSAPGAPELPLAPGLMYLIRPRDIVRSRSAGEGQLRVIVITFPVAEWEAFVAMIGLDGRWAESDTPPVARFDPTRGDETRFLLTAMERFEEGASRLDLVRFWTSVVPRFFPVPRTPWSGTGAPAWLADALAAMHDEENMRAGLPRLRELAHVSAPHLSTTVRRYYRCTPTDLVTSIRLRHAAFLLRTSTQPVAEVGRRTGFSNPEHFATRFRRRYRVSPREYRTTSLGVYPGSPSAESPTSHATRRAKRQIPATRAPA